MSRYFISMKALFFCLLILPALLKAQSNATADRRDTTLFKAEEVPAQFEGYNGDFGEYIKKNINVKYEERYGPKGQIATRYVMRFIVEKNGRVSHAKLETKGNPEISRRLISLARASTWKPMYQNGKAVRVEYGLPMELAFPDK
jgi:hypothetical protein